MTESAGLPTYSVIYAFGDSLSDAGNDSLLTGAVGVTPASPPYYQKIDYQTVPLLGAVPVPVSVFSNGPTWVQDLSVSLGLGTLTPSLLGGTDFAYGGAETGLTPQDGSEADVLAISLPAQLAEFQAFVANPAAGALYTVSIGSNDLLDILANPSLTTAQQAADVAAAVANEVHFVNQLVDDGAKNLLVLGVPNLGQTPDVMDGLANGSDTPSAALDTEASDLSSAYNAALITGLGSIASAGSVDVTVVNLYQFIDQAVADPAAYGLTNVTSPVWSGNYTSASSGTLAASGAAAQDQYLFFDHLHPTETGQLATATLAMADLAQPSYVTNGPAIAGTIADQPTTDQATIAPFSNVALADANAGQTETVTVTLSSVANGSLTNLGGGSYNASTGVYTDTGTAAAVAEALDGLVFTPAARQVAPGQTVTTTFTIQDTDSPAGKTTNDANTTVIATASNVTPPVVTGGGSASYPAGSTAVALDAGLTIGSSVATSLTGATVSIGGFVSGDELNFTSQNGITGSYDGPAGVLALTGSASVANYQAALDSVTYSFLGDPTEGGADTARTISWSGADGTTVSNVATSSLTTSFPSIASQDLLLQNNNGQPALWQVSGTSLTAYGIVGPDPGPSWLAMGSGSFYSGDTDDQLWQNQNGAVAVWQVQGTSLGAYGVVANPGTAWHIDGTGNFYGAGGNNTVVLQNENGAVALWELNGDSIEQYGFAQYQGATANPGPAWQVAATGTLYGGNNADIVLQNTDGTVGIWEMNGNTITQAAVAQYQGATANPGPDWKVMGTGNYFGNGDSDIVLQNGNGQVAIWEMNGGTIEQASMVQYQGSTANPGSDWHVVGTGALSNGGTSDIVLRNTDGTVALWEMSGATITQPAALADPGTSWGVIDGTMRFIDAGAAGETLAATPAAADEFVFDSFAAGTHTITGFDPTRDLIAFSSPELGSYAAVAAATSAVAGGSMIALGGGSSLLLPGVDPAALHAGNFVLT
jgi:phospholipase/lecithinase/hemolysin/plastocyanin